MKKTRFHEVQGSDVNGKPKKYQIKMFTLAEMQEKLPGGMLHRRYTEKGNAADFLYIYPLEVAEDVKEKWLMTAFAIEVELPKLDRVKIGRKTIQGEKVVMPCKVAFTDKKIEGYIPFTPSI